MIELETHSIQQLIITVVVREFNKLPKNRVHIRERPPSITPGHGITASRLMKLAGAFVHRQAVLFKTTMRHAVSFASAATIQCFVTI